MTELSLVDKLNLVRNIMATIESFNQDHGITASPPAIRDTLLVAAGLLHRDAVRLEGEEVDPEQLQETFAEIAGANIRKALEAAQSNGHRAPQ
jgi:hypothetical protein